jgi:PAS domain S-box-containing protein
MNFKTKLTLVIGAAGLAVAAFLGWGWLPEGFLSSGRDGLALAALIAAAAMILAGRVAIGLLLSRPLARIAEVGRQAGLATPVLGQTNAPADQLELATRTVSALREAQEAERLRADEWQQRAKQIQAELLMSEERYTLALRAAADGLWEWDLQEAGRMQLSPRWKSLVGFSDTELPNGVQAWRERIHPSDRANVERALAEYLAGAQRAYEHQFRVLHKDGSVRWLLSRGTAIRHASGKPYRMVGLDTDITRVKRIETIIEEIAQGTAGTWGTDFFRNLVRHFAAALQVPCAFITRCADLPPSRLRTLAFWSNSKFVDNFEYDLPGTPCETVINERRNCFLPNGVGTLFPVEAGYEGYLGIPLLGSDGRILGHLAFLDTKTMGEEILVDSVFRIFSSRASAELERMMAIELLDRGRGTALQPSAAGAAVS